MAAAATNEVIEPLLILGLNGSEYLFYRSEYPLSHYLWCVDHLKAQEKTKEIYQTPVMYEVSKKGLNALIDKYRKRKHEKNHLIAQVIRNIRDGRPYHAGTHCGIPFLDQVLHIIIEEWPYLDTEKFSDMIAPSICNSSLTKEQLRLKLSIKKRTQLKRLEEEK
jgi:hypothetical protein